MTTLIFPQQYVGRLNVVGDCFVFGAALHEGQPVFLDLAGPATSVEAAWARLAQGKETRIVPDSGPSIVLQPPGPGLFARFQRKIEGLAIDHLLLVHKGITEPAYSECTTMYLFHTDTDQAAAILGNHVSRLVKVAVFPEWFPYLAGAGYREGLFSRCVCYGGVNLWAVNLDVDAWTRVIQSGLQTGEIRLP